MPPDFRVCPQPQTGLTKLLLGEDHVDPGSSLEQALRTQAKAKGSPAAGLLIEGWEEIQAHQGRKNDEAHIVPR